MRSLGRLVAMLREDLRDEWEENHDEHCGCDRSPGSECHWQPPLTLQTDDLVWLENRRDQGEDAPCLGQYFRYGDLAMVEVGDSRGCVVVVDESLSVAGKQAVPVPISAPSGLLPALLGPTDAVVQMLGVVPEHPVMDRRPLGDPEVTP